MWQRRRVFRTGSTWLRKASGAARVVAASAALIVAGIVGIGTAVAADADPARSTRISPVITLLLPLDSKDFSRAAEAFRQGFVAAHALSVDRPLFEVVRTDDRPEKVIAEYKTAIDRGVRVVVGPMTRDDVAAIAQTPERVTVPTLALNIPDNVTTLPRNLRIFSLALEAEARQVARTALAEGLSEITVIHTQSPLSKRSRDAYVDAVLQGGGKINEVLEIDAKADQAALRASLQAIQAPGILLAADPDEARLIRPMLPGRPRVFATSQIHSPRLAAQSGAALEGIRFVDMPWFLTPQSPAVAPFRKSTGFSPELERIYALGIDAFRIAAAMFEANRLFTFNGVTGRIAMSGDAFVQRTPVAAEFRKNGAAAIE